MAYSHPLPPYRRPRTSERKPPAQVPATVAGMLRDGAFDPTPGSYGERLAPPTRKEQPPPPRPITIEPPPWQTGEIEPGPAIEEEPRLDATVAALSADYDPAPPPDERPVVVEPLTYEPPPPADWEVEARERQQLEDERRRRERQKIIGEELARLAADADPPSSLPARKASR